MSNDTNTSKRKSDHIDLAFRSQIEKGDPRFFYEPALSGHPKGGIEEQRFGASVLKNPIWVSSMTGGTEKAGEINRILATACGIYGLGMGLGSCRIILEDDTYLKDFQLRSYIGDDHPLFANLGIAQVEELFNSNKTHLITDLVDKTQTNGLIIHINPLQEWLQPEGDRYYASPIETIRRVLDLVDFPVIVKEVGQGFGPKSLKALLELPLLAVDFGSLGGTNFAQLELLRDIDRPSGSELVRLGHTAGEMVEFVNAIVDSDANIQTENIIVSGGIKTYLDGYYHTKKLKMPSIYAQASAMLKAALDGQEAMNTYIEEQIRGLELANAFLEIRS